MAELCFCGATEPCKICVRNAELDRECCNYCFEDIVGVPAEKEGLIFCRPPGNSVCEEEFFARRAQNSP